MSYKTRKSRKTDVKLVIQAIESSNSIQEAAKKLKMSRSGIYFVLGVEGLKVVEIESRRKLRVEAKEQA